MQKTIFLILFLSISLFISNAQTNSIKPSNKKTKTVKSEIDRLAEKYKDSSTVTIYTAYNEIKGDIKINLNVDKKPESIEMHINTKDKNSAVDFIKTIISQKVKDGYSIYNINPESIGYGYWKDNIDKCLGYDYPGFTIILKKANLMFKVNGYENEYYVEKQTLNLIRSGQPTYILTLETVDYSRKGGKKASKFDF